MNSDLFGNAKVPKQICCSLYHDDRIIHDKWLYHGFLFIPSDKTNTFLENLNTARKESTWEKELHFVELDNTRTMNDLALRWIDLFCNNHLNFSYFYFFGIDLTKIQKELWEIRATKQIKIYNRFFQIGLYSAIKWLFLNEKAGYESVTVDTVYSDSKSRPSYDNFRSGPISEIELKALMKEEAISFVNPTIIEVNSDHLSEKNYRNESHIIQYVDIALGSFSQILDNTSTHKGKCKCAEKFLQFSLPKEVMGYDRTHFGSVYYKKYAISFFPKTKLSKDDILNKTISSLRNQFFNEREMKFCNRTQLSFLQ